MSLQSEPVDSKMSPTYDRLASRALGLLGEQSDSEHVVWIAITGGPGAGKSTLAKAVAERVNDKYGSTCCVVLPMDGFHYSRAKLRELDPPDAASYLPRRGSPWTFDAEGLYATLIAAKQTGEAVLPTYSREFSDPVPEGVRLERGMRCVVVEGNYLLLQDDPRWAPLETLWDEKWFLSCADPAEQRRRLIERHLETWNDEKSLRWGEGELGAAARADGNDVKNMELVAGCAKYADLIIESL